LNRLAATWIVAVLSCVNVAAFGEVTGPSIPQDGPGQGFTARVIAVLDGDTVLIRRARGLVKIRLAGIDAPEKGQAFGDISSRTLADMVKGKRVKVASQAVDQYGRIVANLGVDGLDVNAEQVRRGMAWEYSNHHGNKTLVALQDEARQAGRGLWAQPDPMPPWRWRKLHPSPQTAAVARPAAGAAGTRGADCGNKKYCSEMSSCEEAKDYLTQCGVKSLDGNGDGTPCESLCAPREKIKN
jgi:endonuclease YncB( thermonuclease family)